MAKSSPVSRKRKRPAKKGTRKRTTKKRQGKNFIAKAVKHPGSFTRYCLSEGYDGPSMACISHGIHSGNLLREREAVLARTFKEMGARRRARNSRR